jgi:hypothetical protein
VSQRHECKRPLDITSLAFLTAIAAFGFARGVTEFDKAFQTKDINYINQLIIDRENFLRFFWDQSDNNFSFIHCWRQIDRLWDVWESTSPVLIHGFVSASVSDRWLKVWLKNSGTFLLRFSSKGGLAVDFVRDGRIQKTHWKFDELTDVHTLKKRLYDVKRDGPYLLYLVGTSEPKCYPKESVFPLDDETSGYVDSGYQTNENQSADVTADDNEKTSGYVNVVSIDDIVEAKKTASASKFVPMDTKWF